MKKKMLLFVLIMMMLTTLIPAPVTASSNDDISVMIVRQYERLNERLDNVRFDLRFHVQFETPPFMQEGQVLVPLRETAIALGVDAHWDRDTRSITYVNNEGVTYVLTIDYDYATFGMSIEDIQTTRLDAPPQIVNGRTFVPLRFIGESLGVYVYWDSGTRTAVLTVLLVQYEPAPTINLGTMVWVPATGQRYH